MPKKYIDAQKAISEIHKWYKNADVQKCAQDPCVVDAMIDLFVRTLKAIPMEDVAEVRRGKWIKKNGILACSKCEKYAPYYVEADKIEYWTTLNYCPQCGALMEATP